MVLNEDLSKIDDDFRKALTQARVFSASVYPIDEKKIVLTHLVSKAEEFAKEVRKLI